MEGQENFWEYEGFFPEFLQMSSCVVFWRKKSKSDVFRQSVSFITQIEQSCRNIFARIFRDFAKIFRDFARIFDTSKLLGLRLYPLHPRLLHYWRKVRPSHGSAMFCGRKGLVNGVCISAASTQNNHMQSMSISLSHGELTLSAAMGTDQRTLVTVVWL